MTERATVGRIVHFYDFGLESVTMKSNGFDHEGRRINVELNGQGSGPYAALVLQERGGGVNLKVFGPGGDWYEIAVKHKDDIAGFAQRYWEFPPRV